LTLKNNIYNNYDSYPTANINFCAVGGDNQEWNILDNICQTIKNLEPQKTGEDQVKQVYEIENIFESENPRIIDPSRYDSFDELNRAVKYHWIRRLRNEEETIKKRIRRADKISKHPVFPVNFLDLNPNQAIAYLDYRELKEGASPIAILNDWKVITTFARAYGIDTKIWNYRPPRKPQSKVKIIPLPNVVYSLIHHKYSKNQYENALYQYAMFFSFLIGMRIPSELISMKVNDVFLDDGYIIIHEDKKYGQPRQIFPEKEIMTMGKRKSFKNWIEKWRPKVENQYSDDSLFIQPSGKPFTKDYFRLKLSKFGKQVWPEYHPYISRSWCAIARLIQGKVQTNHYNVYEVEEWLGHDRLKTTEGYIKFAQRYYKIAPFDWIKSILKSNKRIKEFKGEENGGNSKKGKIWTLLNEISPVDNFDPPQIRI
jgi:integrase